MERKPVVGISSSVIIDQGGMFPGYKRVYVNKDYVDAVLKNGGIPYVIPFNESKECIEEQVSILDALILSGGHDVSPLNYNEEPLQNLGETFPERDDFDFELLSKAIEKEIPILGICRGNQIINTYFGGKLNQDLAYIDNEKNILKHAQNHSPSLVTHSVHLENSSKIARIFDRENIHVNSFHHQTIKTLGKHLKAVGIAADGEVEAIEHETYPFLLGVQWHPEMLINSTKAMNYLFESLIKEASKDEKKYIEAV